MRMIITCRPTSTSISLVENLGFTPRDGVHEKGKESTVTMLCINVVTAYEINVA